MTKEKKRKPGPAGNWDYVEHGSDEHARVLGLCKATDEDKLQYKGWTLQDRNRWGPSATDRYILDDIRSQVNELNAPTPEVQSEDPLAPNYAPPMWKPQEGRSRL